MKTKCKLLALTLSAFALVFADTEIVSIADGQAVASHRGGKVQQINVLSTVAAGTVTLKSESKLWGMRDVVTDLSTSNFVWTVVFSNGVDIVTNKTTVSPYPLPAARALISATSNWVVQAFAVTNKEPYVTLCKTNALSSAITCSSGVAANLPESKYVAPGDPLFFSGTAKGRVTVILTR